MVSSKSHNCFREALYDNIINHTNRILCLELKKVDTFERAKSKSINERKSQMGIGP